MRIHLRHFPGVERLARVALDLGREAVSGAERPRLLAVDVSLATARALHDLAASAASSGN